VEGFRRFLKIEGERLRTRHRLGLGGTEIASGRSDYVDVLVRRVCQAAAAADRAAESELRQCAVVALGGYGRAELAPHSDVDLLFLHPGRSSSAVAAFVEQVLQVLWDAGLTVGHSFRSPKECVAEARGDLHSRTALTEARLVTGSTDLYETLLGQLETDLRRSRRATEAFLELMRNELKDRFEKYGRAVCVLEPNVKEGPGGLRDLHAVLWVSHARFGTRGISALRADRLITEAEYALARRAHDFLSRLRNEAHFATGRKSDLLTLDLQGDLALGLGYRPRGHLLASEILMRDYYRRASELHRFCRTFMRSHLEAPQKRLFPTIRLRRATSRSFEVREGRLHARAEGGSLRGGAGQLMEAFEVAQVEGVPFSEELKLTIHDRAHLVDHAFRASPDGVRSFLRLLERRGRVAETLRALHETGLLGRLLPEWARITFLVQHDLFHKYTVDEHTLKALEALDEVASGQDAALTRLGQLFDEVEDTLPLYLGMLLHDIGKGRGPGHVERGVRVAERIVKRLLLGPETADKVRFLVGAHLEMSQISQHRDLSEPSLIDAFAARVGSVDRLNLLLLLTYADHRGVGPGIWNEWKASLLFELYSRTRPRIGGGERRVENDRGTWARDRVAADLTRHFPKQEVERHFSALSERYLRTTDAARMVWHFRLVRHRGERSLAVDWADLGDGQGTELVVTADDRPGLFALLAGALTANGVDIMSVDLFARADGIVLDTFRVSEIPGPRPLRPERRARLESALADAVSGRVDVGHLVDKWRAQKQRKPPRHWGRAAKAPRVRFDQEASAVSTVVEVKAQDQPGLAYTIAATLAELGLDITFARVATAKALALDVFYVRDREGRKLGPGVCAEVETALLAAFGAGPRIKGNG
jgi:[protein-PII] uridylyltransferase